MKKLSFLLLIVFLVVFCFGCNTQVPEEPVEPIPKTPINTQDMSVIGDEISFKDFKLTVSSAEIDYLLTMVLADSELQVMKIIIDYPTENLLTSLEVSLTDIYGDECELYLGDGLDYLGAYRGERPYIRFVVPALGTEFVLTLTGGTQVHIIKGTTVDLPEKNDEEKEDEDAKMKTIFSNLKSSQNIVSIEGSKLSEDEYIMLASLQGIVAQNEARIVIKSESWYSNYTEYLKSKDYTETVYTNAWDIVKLFISSLGRNGYIKFNRSEKHDINLAATVAGAEKWLMVPSQIENAAIEAGLVKRYDFTNTSLSSLTPLQRKTKIFNDYKDKLNKGALVHQSPDKTQLRDFSIALKIFCFYTDEKNAQDKAFRNTVFQWADNNIPVMGWTDDEIAFVADCSKYGKFVLPMDWAANHSYFSGVRLQDELKQKSGRDNIKAQAGKHYVAIVVSDGDNIQWITRDFASPGGLFGRRLSGRTDYKVTWTFPPYISELGTITASYIYDIASNKDSFAAGVSGAGYINATSYPNEHLESFTKLTSELMEACDINIVTMLDNKNNITSDAFAREKIDYYARFDNIKGGIWELDPDRYESGKGKIYWSSNGKPFMSVRLSMWHNSNNPANVTKEWAENYAKLINGYTIDPTKAEGYTIVNVHPWTVTDIGYLENMVSKLAGHVEIVSAEEIIKLAAENIVR